MAGVLIFGLSEWGVYPLLFCCVSCGFLTARNLCGGLILQKLFMLFCTRFECFGEVLFLCNFLLLRCDFVCDSQIDLSADGDSACGHDLVVVVRSIDHRQRLLHRGCNTCRYCGGTGRAKMGWMNPVSESDCY
jgi:hypothetical protein